MVGEDVRNPNNPDVKADWTEIRKFNLMFETKQ
jgi:glycyl-tRNA synthetase (class II)